MTQENKNDAPNLTTQGLGVMDEARQQLEGSLDTIKEILIGEHTRETQKKMNLLEERVAKELIKFEQKLTHISQVSNSHFNELRDRLLNESHTLSEEFLRRYRTLYEEIEKTVNSLEFRKADRQFIATQLMRMAGSIQTEPQEQVDKSVTDLKTKVKKSG